MFVPFLRCHAVDGTVTPFARFCFLLTEVLHAAYETLGGKHAI